MRPALLLLLIGWVLPAAAEEVVDVCYNWGCIAQSEVVYDDRRLLEIERLMALADSDESERALLSQAIGRLYQWAGEQSPIRNDRGGNDADYGVYGRMDCIDHSITTTRLLWMMERRGWLRWHRVTPPVRRTRFFFGQHFSAAIQTVRPEDGGLRFAVDTWFMDNGEPAAILPLEFWLQGDGPDVE